MYQHNTGLQFLCEKIAYVQCTGTPWAGAAAANDDNDDDDDDDDDNDEDDDDGDDDDEAMLCTGFKLRHLSS